MPSVRPKVMMTSVSLRFWWCSVASPQLPRLPIKKGKEKWVRAEPLFFCVAFIKRDCCIVKLVNVFFLGNHCSVMMNERRRRKKLLISKKERPFHGALLMEVHQQERNTELSSNGACTTTRLMQSSVYIFPFIFGPTRSVGQEEHLRQELVPLSRDDVCWYGRLINLSLSCCSLSPFGSSACVHYTARCARVFITPRLLLLQQLLCVSLSIYIQRRIQPITDIYIRTVYIHCVYTTDHVSVWAAAIRTPSLLIVPRDPARVRRDCITK